MSFKPQPDRAYFLPLGGVGEIGCNCYLYGWQGQWLMVDCGLNFAPKNMPGIDLILPDVSFAAKLGNKLAGILITHGHEDHIGAIEYVWPQLQCPVYAVGFAYDLLRHKLTEAGLIKDVELIKLPAGGKAEEIKNIGPFEIELVSVTHSIPDAQSVVIRTDQGTLVHTGDWKLDSVPLIGPKTDAERFKALGKEGILAVVGDSTNADRPGASGSEKRVRDTLKALIKDLPNAVAVTCFSSNVARLSSVLLAAKESGRDVCLVGRSLKRNVEIALAAGYLKDIPNLVPEEDSGHVPRDRILYVCTGCQGEPRAAMRQIAGGNHRHVALEDGDTVIFSAMKIPGNELEIDNMQNLLALRGITVIDAHHPGIHVSGHPCQDELRNMYEWLQPEMLIPMHGEAHHLKEHANLARSVGIEQVVDCQNGSIVEFHGGHAKVVGAIALKEVGLEEERHMDINGKALQQRKKISYAGAGVATILMKDGQFLRDITVTLFGLTDTADQEAVLHNESIEAIRAALGGLPKDKLREPAVIREKARVAFRRTLKALTGKKPVVDVQLIELS